MVYFVTYSIYHTNLGHVEIFNKKSQQQKIHRFGPLLEISQVQPDKKAGRILGLAGDRKWSTWTFWKGLVGFCGLLERLFAFDKEGEEVIVFC